MQARLDKWKANIQPVASAEKLKQSYIPRRDYGDDVRDYENKDSAIWQNEFLNKNFR